MEKYTISIATEYLPFVRPHCRITRTDVFKSVKEQADTYADGWEEVEVYKTEDEARLAFCEYKWNQAEYVNNFWLRHAGKYRCTVYALTCARYIKKEDGADYETPETEVLDYIAANIPAAK